MKMFELNGRKRKNGRRPFKAILHEVYPTECVENKVGTQYNENGICWIEQYCENNIDTIKGMSLTVEFADAEEQTELLGHGDTGIEDGLPVFDNATIVGNFERGYIADIDDNGTTKKVVIGEGTIDQMRCNKFVKYLEERCASGDVPYGSVEISNCEGRGGIEYLNGKYEEGRIPTVFDYSGYSLLGVRPADNTAKIIELNQTESEVNAEMNEEMKKVLDDILAKIDETAACKAELSQAQADREAVIAEKNEITANAEQIQAALDELHKEYEELNKKYDALWEERNTLEKALGEARAKERLGELNAALSAFTDEQIAYAADEKAAFEADPVNSEINTVVDKIYMEIGKHAAEEAKRQSEINAHQDKPEEHADDIFSEVNTINPVDGDEIF